MCVCMCVCVCACVYVDVWVWPLSIVQSQHTHTGYAHLAGPHTTPLIKPKGVNGSICSTSILTHVLRAWTSIAGSWSCGQQWVLEK